MTKLKKNYDIDFMVPAKSNFVATKRLKTEAQNQGFDKIKPVHEIKLIKEVTNAPNYDSNLQAIVVKYKKAKKKQKKTIACACLSHLFIM